MLWIKLFRRIHFIIKTPRKALIYSHNPTGAKRNSYLYYLASLILKKADLEVVLKQLNRIGGDKKHN